nr:2964_t:CDS:2 [Entrophospora candida]
MSDTLTIDQIRSKLRAGELFLKEKQGGRSDVWDKFSELVDLDDKMIGYVVCRNCDYITKYNYKLGTSNLRRHRCCNLDNQSKITSFLQKNEAPANVKELIKKKSINFVCRDLRPFEIVSGKGFQEFAQELVNIGSVYGPLSIDELLPNPTTISCNIVKIAESIKSNLGTKLIEIFKKIDDTSHTAKNIKNNIFGCKSLVTYFKQSSLYCRLEKSLKQESESRWNSKLEMLESISDQFSSECLEASKYTTISSCTSLMKQLKILESYDAEWVKNEIRHWYGIFSFQLASDKNHDDDNDETEENEIDKYLSSRVQKELDLNILECAPSEREFSAAGLTINETRSNLRPETVDSVFNSNP